MSEFSEELRVVSGSPTAEELATIIAMLEASHAEEGSSAIGYERSLKSSWSRNVSQMRQPLTPGSGQWRGAYRQGLS